MPGPVNMVSPEGKTVTVPEEQQAAAFAAGFHPESDVEGVQRVANEQEQVTYGGIGGQAAAAGAGVLRGLTLGASDAALGALDTNDELSTLKRINPISSTVGEIGGALAGSLAAPGSLLSRTPTGVLARYANEGVEAARAAGGVTGFLGQAAATGGEAAIQNAGSYLSSVALGDRDLTAEGLGGALGSGFALGAAGGAAVYGLERGSIAARNLFARTMEGGEDAARSAAGAWERKSTEAFEANRANIEEAKRRVAEAVSADDAAQLAKQRAGSYVADERVLGQRVASEPPPPVPESATAAIGEGAPAASTAGDRVAAMEDRIRAGAVPGEAGPFNAEGLRAAAQREIARDDARAAMGGFDFAPQTGQALRTVERRGTAPTMPAPAQRLAAVANEAEDAQSALMRTLQDTKAPVETSFADEALRASAKAEKYNPELAFISSVYDNMNPALRGATLDEFKQRLIEAQMHSKLSLERADLVDAMNPSLVDASETNSLGAQFHFLRTQRPRGAPSSALPTAAAEAERSPLMRALQGTKAQIDEGATIGQVGTAARAQPVSPKQLTAQYDNLVEQAASTTDIETKQALLRQASAIEDRLAQMPRAHQALADVDSVSQAMGRYEKAMADLSDELGDAAHPVSRDAADGFRKAESDAERKLTDRATQHIDDHAEGEAKTWREFTAGKMGAYMKSEGGHAGAMARLSKEWEAYKAGRTTSETAASGVPQGETFGPTQLPPKERIAWAKARKLEADAEAAKTGVAVTEAKQGLKAAQARGKEIEQAAQTVGLPGPATKGGGAASGVGHRALDIGTALEVASTVGIPGLPKPSDIPVVGPLLSLYLKARALKAGADRLMGRIPATGNAKVASLAAATQDKAARAVDRMLGLVERTAPAQRTIAAVAGPKLVDAVRDRLHDDGSKAPAKDAGLQEHVAARSREISALVSNPTLIASQVRKEMRDVADPDMVNAAIQFRTKQLQYLDGVAPKEPPPSPFRKEPWAPDKMSAADFARRYAVAMDPTVALEQVAQKTLTPEAAEAFRAVYPKLFEQTQARLLDKATTLQTTLPRAQLTRMSILFKLPLDSALEPDRLARTQAVFADTGPRAPAQPAAPPAPSIAGNANLSSIYQTASDRRAAAR